MRQREICCLILQLQNGFFFNILFFAVLPHAVLLLICILKTMVVKIFSYLNTLSFNGNVDLRNVSIIIIICTLKKSCLKF